MRRAGCEGKRLERLNCNLKVACLVSGTVESLLKASEVTTDPTALKRKIASEGQNEF